MSICTAAEIKDMVLSFCMPITNPTVAKAPMHLTAIIISLPSFCPTLPWIFRDFRGYTIRPIQLLLDYL